MPKNYYPDDDPDNQSASDMACTGEQSLHKLAELLRLSGNTV